MNGTNVGTYTHTLASTTGTLTFTHPNYLGTPVLATNDDGDIIEAFLTDTLGNPYYKDSRADAAFHTKGYTGHMYDSESSLTYAHARYLDTTTHSFLSNDPLQYNLPQAALYDPQSLNGYAYARNNPVLFTDPTGQIAILIPIAGMLLIDFITNVDTAHAPSVNTETGEPVYGPDSAYQTYAPIAGLLIPSSGAVSAAKSLAKYSVYVGRDADEVIRYVGITMRDPVKRFAEHLASKGTGKELLSYDLLEGAKDLSRSAARLIEQSQINTYGLAKNGGQLLNKINSISPSNSLYSAVDSVQKYISSGGKISQSSIDSLYKSVSGIVKKLKNDGR